MAKPTKNQIPEASVDEQEPRLEQTTNAEAQEVKPKAKKAEPRLARPAQRLPATEVEKDYLRKYQYRKQTVPGSVESDPIPGSKAHRMKTILLAQPRIRMFIPRLQGEDASILQSVTINGYRLDFPKQAYIEVPQQVADVLMESLGQTETALQYMRIDGDKRKENALL